MSAIKLTAELAAAGYSSAELARLTKADELVRIRRGAYAAVAGADAVDRHRQLVVATLLQCDPGAVVSHLSAAVLHGLPIWADRLARVDLTRGQSGGGRARRYVRLHGLPLAAEQVVILGGLRVTSLARTVLDVACMSPLEQAVSIGDAALRAGLDRAEFDDLVGRARGRHGIGVARRAAGLLDPRAESPGESWSRVLFDCRGLPVPTPQFDVFDPAGLHVARADFGWPELRTLGEFDGQVKYGRALQDRQDIEEVLFAEKVREDALRDLGWQVVRWIWSDLSQPAALLARLSRAFERGRRAG